MAEKQKFHIEYLVKASLEMLYQYILAPELNDRMLADFLDMDLSGPGARNKLR